MTKDWDEDTGGFKFNSQKGKKKKRKRKRKIGVYEQNLSTCVWKTGH